MTIKQALVKSIQQLQKAHISSAHLDAEILLADVLGKPKEFLCAHPEYILPKYVETLHATSLRRRLGREPIAYIINQKEFYGLDFYVDSRVLIPRPATENLVDQIKSKILNLKSKNRILNLKFNKNSFLNTRFCIIDIGAGSGCIIVSLIKTLLADKTIKNFNQQTYIATDISADAIAVAKINAKKHKIDHLIKFYQGDLLKPVIKSFPKLLTFNFELLTFIITANLPYITLKKYLTLEPEIKKYEPKLALLTPINDADYYYKKLDKQIAELQKMTKAKIWRFYETGFSLNNSSLTH